MSTPNTQVDGANGGGVIPSKCVRCGKNYGVDCLRGSSACFGCDSIGKRSLSFLMLQTKVEKGLLKAK